MKRHFLVFLVLLAVALMVLGLDAQNPPQVITLGGQTFEIGMSREKALAELSTCCTISPGAPEPDSWSVTTKGPPFEILGFIWFAKGKVSMIRRDRGQFRQEEAVSLAQSLFRLISEAEQSGSQMGMIETATEEGTNLTIRTITLRFRSGKSIVLDIHKVDLNQNQKGKMGDWVDLGDTLAEPH